MATAYTPILQLALPVTGELQGTWGTVVNDNITSMIEQAIAGLATINTWTTASHTLTTANGTTSEARCAVLECSGAPGAAATVICPASTKLYVIKNSVTGGYAVTLKTSAGTGISVPNGATALLYCDGTNVVSGATYMATVSTTQVDILAQGDLRLQDSTGGEYVALQAPATLASSYTLTMPADDGTAGQALITDGSGVLSWSTAASGDVYGPASATDNAVARYDGTTGKIIQNSAVTIADDGATVIAANSASDGLRITQLGAGNALVVEDSANPDATPFVVTAAGDAIFGSTTQYGAGLYTTPIVNVNYGNGSTNSGMAINAWGLTGTTAPRVTFARSSGSLGTYTSVVDSSNLGGLFWHGADGTAFIQAASIFAQVDGTPGTNDMPGRLTFNTTADGASTPTERMRIDSAGQVGIGGTPSAGASFIVSKNITGATTSYGIAESGTVQSDVTTAANMFLSNPKTVASAFTLGNLYHYNTIQGTKGAGSTITNQFGFNADSTLTGATNNYGFYGNIASGTGRYNFYAAGTADNYFAGNVGIGIAPSYALDVDISFSTDRAFRIYNIDTVLNDAELVHTILFTQNDASSPNGGNAWIKTFAVGSIGNLSMAFAVGGSNAPVERLRINGSTGVISLGAAVGSESLRVTPIASAVNFVEVYGAITTEAPEISAQGSDTNIDLKLTTKGIGGVITKSSGQSTASLSTTTFGGAIGILDSGGVVGSGGAVVFGASSGSWRFAAIKSFVTSSASNTQGDLYFLTRRNATDATLTPAMQIVSSGVISLGAASGSESLRVTPVASAVNYVEIQGQATSGAPQIYAKGSDTNILLEYYSKGTGSHVFYTNGAFPARAQQFTIAHTASAVNYAQVSGGATGSPPTIQATGSDTNVPLAFLTKGTGYYNFQTGGGAQFLVSHTASAVNYLQVTGSSTSNAPNIAVAGSDTNINLVYITKGTGAHYFQTSSTNQFVVAHTASAVNYLQVSGTTTGIGPVMTSQGSDANINIVFLAKGTGGYGFGTGGGGYTGQFGIAHTASAVNYLQVTGAATGGAPVVSAQGSDTNIDLALTPKGTGVLKFGTHTAGVVAQAGYITIKDAGGTTRRLLVG